VPIQRAINPVSGTNWEGVGIIPEIEVAADAAYAEAYGRALEHVLGLAHEPGRREVSEEARTALDELRAAPTS
jgi:hypothetical protein